jgi:hypothetical protein
MLAYRSETAVGSAPAERVRPDRPAPIRKPRVAKHQPRLSDGRRHPVTVRKVSL